MKVKERYNIIINTIEELAQGKVSDGAIKTFKTLDIGKKAFEKAGCFMDERSKNVIFMFLMDKNVKDYIEERKMMAAYLCLIESNDWNKEVICDAITLAGVEDDKSFAKKFKKYFSISPMKAYKNKDKSLYVGIKDWSVITAEGKSGFVDFEEEDMAETKFGISKEKYMLAYAAGNLQAFYNLNEVESELAFDLCQEKKVSIEDTFEYIYNYVWSYLDEDSEGRDERLYEDLMNPKVLYMYFDCGMTFNEIILVLHALAKNKLPRKLIKADKRYLLGFWKYCKCFNNEYRSHFYTNNYSYEELYSYYSDHTIGEENINNYLSFIGYAVDMSIEDAMLCADYKKDTRYNEEEDIETSSWDYVKEDFKIDSFDYEPDFDDVDEAQSLWSDDRSLENYSTALNYLKKDLYGSFNLRDFELLCESLDSEKETEEKSTKRLIGYRNLDIEAMEQKSENSFEFLNFKKK